MPEDGDAKCKPWECNKWDPKVDWAYNKEYPFKFYLTDVKNLGQETRLVIKDIFGTASKAPCLPKYTREHYEKQEIIEDHL